MNYNNTEYDDDSNNFGENDNLESFEQSTLNKFLNKKRKIIDLDNIKKSERHSLKRNNTRIPIIIKLQAIKYAKEFNNCNAAHKFNVDESTIRKWRKNEEEYKKVPQPEKKISIHKGPKSIYGELEPRLIRFIEINRRLGKKVTIYSIINQLCNYSFQACLKKKKTLQQYAYRLLEKYYYSIRRTNYLENIISANEKNLLTIFYDKLKQLRIENNFTDDSVICNLDEIPFSYRIYNENIQEKFSVILSITGDGKKLTPFVIFRGKTKQKKCITEFIQENTGNLVIACCDDVWTVYEIMLIWLQKVWLPYIFKPDKNGCGLILMDMLNSYAREEFLKILDYTNQKYLLIPSDVTKILNPLNIIINESFKRFMDEYYVKECCNKVESGNKPFDRETIFNWIANIWYTEKIRNNMILKSFKACGITKKEETENKKPKIIEEQKESEINENINYFNEGSSMSNINEEDIEDQDDEEEENEDEEENYENN